MKLIKDLKETKFGLEGEVYFGLFDEYISLMIERESNAEFANQCAILLNELSEPVIDHLCRASQLYCNDFLDQIGEPQIEFESNRSVLKIVYPGLFIVPVPNETNTPVVHLELNCDWEEEHGMEWVIRDNSVLYVGGFNSYNPYGEFESQDGWNYAWQTA